ncbi:hypothetical protein D0T12_34420 [Actinomadura spongiicola]|uniref:Zinc-finger domain-containing protein n=1 Tax=Actinomadura spongiicola TaxID=2303421 RepID=A0A372G6E3_9ACTN|nr:hypothetical protein [Actinomadura spongiicola]RFS80968.1 hypothetical protein D0T12_34420 [Actinomadura spongiicola]
MRCQRAREAISASIDDQDPGVGTYELLTHVNGCTACGDWLNRVVDLNRELRATPPSPAPDLTDRIMLNLNERRPRSRRPLRVLQVLLATIAACQIVVGCLMVVVPMRLLHEGGLTHDLREVGAFNLAFGVGFLTAALRPRLVWGVLPVVTFGAVMLTGTALEDLRTGEVVTLREAHHSLLLAGCVVLICMVRLIRTRPASPGGGTPPGRDRSILGGTSG